MNNNIKNVVAQGAATWKEKHSQFEETQRQIAEEQERQKALAAKEREEGEIHYRIMSAIGSSFVRAEYEGTEEEPYYPYAYVKIYHYTRRLPPQDLLDKIMARGRHDEVMALLKAYAASQEQPRYRPDEVFTNLYPEVNIPEDIQVFVARRGNREELELFCQKQGFGAAGQDILLERNDHEELMWYLSLHGFLPEQQRKLKALSDKSLYHQHILHHGLAAELLDEIIDKLKCGQTDSFYEFLSLREFPVSHQKPLLGVMAKPEFLAYIDRYGFWEEVLEELVIKRSDEELEVYLHKHHYLGRGVYVLAQKKNAHQLFRLAMREYPEEERGVSWIYALEQGRPLDYELLTECFLKVKIPEKMSDAEIAEIKLLRDGTREEVLNYLQNRKKGRLSNYAKATLFFRETTAEYEAYLNLH